MKHGIRSSVNDLSRWDVLLSAFRRFLQKYHINSPVSTLRALVHFGPWRFIPQSIIRRCRPVQQSVCETVSMLSLDARTIAADVRQNSVSVAGVLPKEFVNRLRKVTDNLPVDHYQLMHHIDNDVRKLSEDPAIKNVLREYFKCEPVLLESTLFITAPNQKRKPSGQHAFHFDYAGWESLNVFVYLSDVTAKSAYHSVAKGSHHNIGFRDVIHGALTDDEALFRFGSTIQNILGLAGTVFFENTEAYHKRNPSDERRVMLNLLFATHRSLLSNGRTSRKHIKFRAQTYDRFRASN